MDDVADAADDLHLAPLLVVVLDPPLRLTDILGCGANLLPDLVGFVFVVRVPQLPQLLLDGFLLLVASQAFLDRLYAKECLCDERDVVEIEGEPKKVTAACGAFVFGVIFSERVESP